MNWDNLLEERLRIIHWLIDGQGRIGIPITASTLLTTDRIVELYNVERDEIGLILDKKPKEELLSVYRLGSGFCQISGGTVNDEIEGELPFIALNETKIRGIVGFDYKQFNYRPYNKIGIVFETRESLEVFQDAINRCRAKFIEERKIIITKRIESNQTNGKGQSLIDLIEDDIVEERKDGIYITRKINLKHREHLKSKIFDSIKQQNV